jgi:hypothetical protein
VDEYVRVWTVVALSDVPMPHNLFRDMERYRLPCWASAIDYAVHALRETEDVYAVIRLLENTALCDADLDAAISLLLDPIVVEVGHDRLINGQHRTQAMREQGAETVLVTVDRLVWEKPLGEELSTV